MSKSHFQAYSGETLTSMVYYSFILKQSRKRIPALLTQHMTAKTRWCLFYSLNIQNMISFRPLPRWIFFSVKLIRIIMDRSKNEHLCSKSPWALSAPTPSLFSPPENPPPVPIPDLLFGKSRPWRGRLRFSYSEAVPSQPYLYTFPLYYMYII